MLRELAQRAPVHDIDWPAWRAHGVAVSLWRLDALDAAGSGNKLFKLAENFHAARAAGHSRILSFGGAFSNHIHALALSGRAAKRSTIPPCATPRRPACICISSTARAIAC